ncbi:alpha/beta fold hydrolase [Chryseobacterium sp. PTM-20240506]|uniref:alpha/beta fold hydrolase n=1 Tax=unclassified Chryseobacterium TaxID=2593645 RepID=UPI00235A2E60|nr:MULTISPECIES: alpha/beta hydrolase [unclassified Chryseobacterium]MDC8103979.1 alpha/beta hydrolase [Chryseobacterium sp. B21-037]MDQ1803584.1 alpha/beta hydrolase [Chryseobacterium sp. CKR4-1]WBV57520.1 alpha/beta hydrolase [Chryseobacterium daecheongense]
MNPTIYYNNTDVDGLNIFYRESGPEDAPVLLLLHGFPTSSHMFRNLIPKLNDQYHIIAPDLPGFGFSDAPDSDHFSYTFDNLARIMQGFIDRLELKRFALYIFDYGAPTGLRLALANPEKITGIISQNGNAYEEGLSDSWSSIRKYWEDPTPENRKLLSDFTSEKMTKFQYQEGVKDLSLIAPESYALDQHFLDRPGMNDIQIDLMLDYRTNVALYPEFQAYFRKYQPRFLAAWGKYDPFFLPPGAEAYKKDIPDAIVKFYETGHFALETHTEEISNDIREFLKGLPS